MILRDYQLAASATAWAEIAVGRNTLIVIPTGGGKTPVIADLCRRVVSAGGRVAVLAHVRELLEQSAGALAKFGVEAGVVSAGLSRREVDKPVVVAGIQSVFRDPQALGVRHVVIIDEAHMVNEDEDSMYRQALTGIAPQAVCGLTATPYRLDGGLIYGPDKLWPSATYEVGVLELVRRGFLCRLTTRAPSSPDMADAHIRQGDWVPAEAESAMIAGLSEQVADIKAKTSCRKSVLVFAVTVDHAKTVAATLGDDAAVILGETESDARTETISAFKSGAVKYLVNVGVLTTGFDSPGVDCVVMLRPTMSAGLYYQMLGRGFRIADGKTDCLVLDYSGNLIQHGPVDCLNPEEPVKRGESRGKKCPACEAVIASGATTCPECGHQIPRKPREVSAGKANGGAALSDDQQAEWRDVLYTDYLPHRKRGVQDAPEIMRACHVLREPFGRCTSVSEWVCLHHPNQYAASKAEQWWRARSDEPLPATIADAIFASHTCKPVARVKLVQDGDWPKIVGFEFGEQVAKLIEKKDDGLDDCPF